MAPDATNDDVLCERHNVKESPYGDGRCPYCEEEAQIEALERERQKRRANPNMHPDVDARRR